MWSHYCKAEKHSMYVEDGAECNWCGIREEDKSRTVTNVEVTDMPDGSARVNMDIDVSAQKILMKQGLEYLINEMRANDDIKVMEPNDFSKDTKRYELSDDEANALFHFGFIDALKLRTKIIDTLPQPNTIEEWKEFGHMWLNGNGDQLQWMDTSEHADKKWYDVEDDDAWYPYDTNLVYRRKV